MYKDGPIFLRLTPIGYIIYILYVYKEVEAVVPMWLGYIYLIDQCNLYDIVLLTNSWSSSIRCRVVLAEQSSPGFGLDGSR